jgi:hypothetical protein
VADPLQPPLHETLFELIPAVNAGGSVTLIVTVPVQLEASVTVTVYEPAQSAVIDEVVSPPGAHA